ncbi:MAG: PHP domain-containing protein [Desulfobulbales bacterium]
MCVDLHLHSIYSDGTLSPSELVKHARRNNLCAIALTDHDTVDGIHEILAYGRQNNIQIISGLEVSSTHRQYSLHILGYGIDHTNCELHQWLARLQRGRTARNEQIIASLQRHGLKVDLEELQAISRCGQTGRPHIAALLLNKGIVDSFQQAFTRYLRKGAPAWVSRFSYSAAESINMIHRAGGLAVLAHPGQLDPELKILPLLTLELVERGLDGIEVYYPSHSASVQKRLLQIAKKYKLVVTGGSDYHGENRAFSSMAGKRSGFCPPDIILSALAERM